MIIHKFQCIKCGFILHDTNTKIIHVCPHCKYDMEWVLNIGGSKGDYQHISDSLAISPDQIVEHKQQFPDVDVLSDGRLQFNSFKSHDDYLDKTGFVKIPQKIKSKGKRIK